MTDLVMYECCTPRFTAIHHLDFFHADILVTMTAFIFTWLPFKPVDWFWRRCFICNIWNRYRSVMFYSE